MGVTTSELVSDTWSAAGENNISFWVDVTEAPKFEPFELEEDTNDEV